jgi:hypothetical protein
MLVFGALLLLLGDLLLLNLGGTASRLAATARRTPWLMKGPFSGSDWPWRALGGLVAAIGLAIVIVQGVV